MGTAMVSIIVPVYQCERFIAETITCVQNQTYSNWELLLVDDCTLDNSAEIIQRYAQDDRRIRYIKLEVNSGAAIARNKGLEHAQGRYIAYLDADDVWHPQKLERQIDFMTENDVQFSCCDYERITEDGASLHKVIHMPKTITYNQLLSNTVIQTVGVIVDLSLVNKELLIMPNVRRGQDSATWLQMLRNGVVFQGQNEVLAQYRRVPLSLSANKVSALKRTWYLYRGVEHLSLAKSCVCLVGWAYHASIKRIYRTKRVDELQGTFVCTGEKERSDTIML